MTSESEDTRAKHRAAKTDTASEDQKDELTTETTPGLTTEEDLWRNPAGTPGRGLTTGSEAERPRDREANDGGGKVPGGATQTSPSGSAGGRLTYGIANDYKGEPEADEP